MKHYESEKPLVAVVAPLHEHVHPNTGESLVLGPLEELFEILPVAIDKKRSLPDAITLKDIPKDKRDQVSIIITDGENGVQGEHMDMFPSAVGISNFGTGTDPIDITAANERGLIVCNTPEVLNRAAADMCLGLVLNLVNNTAHDNQWLRKGRWQEGRPPLHDDLRNKTVGIYGMGSIGNEVASRLCDLTGQDIHYHNRKEIPPQRLLPAFNTRAKYHSSLLELAKASDILICSARLNEGTRNSINTEVLKQLGANGCFVNIGRGEIHVEQDVVQALKNGTIKAAALDVHHEEGTAKENLYGLMDEFKLIATPHVASGTVWTRRQMGRLMIANALALYISGGKSFIRSVNAEQARHDHHKLEANIHSDDLVSRTQVRSL